MRLTVSGVKALKSGEELRDDVLTGFGARKQRDKISYFLQTTIDGRRRHITIGRHGAPWTLDEARKKAREMLRAIEEGRDPKAPASTGDARPAPVVTVRQAAKRFLEEHGPKLSARSFEEYERILKLHILPKLGKTPVAAVAHSDATRLHVGLKDRPRIANFTLAVLSKFMSWAELQGLRDGPNPCRGVSKFKENARHRYLSQDELQRLAGALIAVEREENESPYVVAAIRLLLLTGARLNEILTLQWRFVDLERGLIFLPTSKTGVKQIFLSEGAVRVLQGLPRLKKNPYVIVGAREGAHVINLQKPWRRIRERAEIVDVRIHDLRHSYASFAAANGASLPQIGALLGHKDANTTKRYAHLAAAPLHQVNAGVGDMLSSVFAKNTGGDDEKFSES